jgi:hypothetical protein
MKLSYDFQQYEPPKLTEEKLSSMIQKRRDVRWILLLAIASNLIWISLALLALVVSPYSMSASIICLVLLGVYLSGSGILAVLFTKKLIDKYGKASVVHFALNH